MGISDVYSRRHQIIQQLLLGPFTVITPVSWDDFAHMASEKHTERRSGSDSTKQWVDNVTTYAFDSLLPSTAVYGSNVFSVIEFATSVWLAHWKHLSSGKIMKAYREEPSLESTKPKAFRHVAGCCSRGPGGSLFELIQRGNESCKAYLKALHIQQSHFGVVDSSSLHRNSYNLMLHQLGTGTSWLL